MGCGASLISAPAQTTVCVTSSAARQQQPKQPILCTQTHTHTNQRRKYVRCGGCSQKLLVLLLVLSASDAGRSQMLHQQLLQVAGSEQVEPVCCCCAQQPGYLCVPVQLLNVALAGMHKQKLAGQLLLFCFVLGVV